jgi:uncharacterized membrane protein
VKTNIVLFLIIVVFTIGFMFGARESYKKYNVPLTNKHKQLEASHNECLELLDKCWEAHEK